jgi:hypothetical protein
LHTIPLVQANGGNEFGWQAQTLVDGSWQASENSLLGHLLPAGASHDAAFLTAARSVVAGFDARIAAVGTSRHATL